jgi:hypothetical protein
MHGHMNIKNIKSHYMPDFTCCTIGVVALVVLCKAVY